MGSVLKTAKAHSRSLISCITHALHDPLPRQKNKIGINDVSDQIRLKDRPSVLKLLEGLQCYQRLDQRDVPPSLSTLTGMQWIPAELCSPFARGLAAPLKFEYVFGGTPDWVCVLWRVGQVKGGVMEFNTSNS